jgi:hypothetical protein
MQRAARRDISVDEPQVRQRPPAGSTTAGADSQAAQLQALAAASAAGVAQRKRADMIDNSPRMVAQRQQAPVVQKVTIETVKSLLPERFDDDVLRKFTLAWNELKGDAPIPTYLIEKLSDGAIPLHYLPTTKEIWIAFINKILKYKDAPLTRESIGRMDLSEVPVSEGAEKYRTEVLGRIGKADAATNKGDLPDRDIERYLALKPLGEKILAAPLTCNFALDTLFKYSAPQMVNAFELKAKLGTSVQNIEGDLEKERREKEEQLFKFEDSIHPRLRPRYAALNFHGHAYGAAARNDYGLSHMVLNPAVKERATFTCGDTFDTDRAYSLNRDGVEAMLRVMASQSYMFGENKKLLEDGIYKPGDVYFDTQIHQDLDIRKDVDEINISTVEMKLFNTELRVVDELIGNLTNDIFVRQTG